MSFSLSQTQMPVCHHDVNMLTSSPSKVTAHLRSWNIFFSISKVTEFGCLSILHLSVSLPLHTHRCNTWDAVRADGSGVPFSNPFHLYLYIELYSSVENQITLSTLQLSVFFLHPLTQNTSNVLAQTVCRALSCALLAVWMPRPAAFLRNVYIWMTFCQKKNKKNKSEREQTENYILNVHQHIYGHQTHTTSAFTVAFTTLVKLPGMPILFMYITYWKIGGGSLTIVF